MLRLPPVLDQGLQENPVRELLRKSIKSRRSIMVQFGVVVHLDPSTNPGLDCFAGEQIQITDFYPTDKRDELCHSVVLSKTLGAYDASSPDCSIQDWIMLSTPCSTKLSQTVSIL